MYFYVFIKGGWHQSLRLSKSISPQLESKYSLEILFLYVLKRADAIDFHLVRGDTEGLLTISYPRRFNLNATS